MLRRWLWIPLSLGLLAFVIWRTRPWELAGAGLALDPLLLLAVVTLNVAVVALWALRSRSLMAGVGHPLGFLSLVPVVSFANTIGNVTPASAGEALRALVLRNRYGVPIARSTAVILVERVWAVGIMAVTASAAAALAFGGSGSGGGNSSSSGGGPSPVAAVIVTVSALLACFLPAVAYRVGLRPGRLLERWLARRKDATATRPGRLGRAAGVLVDLDRTVAGLVADPVRAVVFVGSTLLIFVCYALQLALLLQMLGSPLPLEGAWAALGLATVAGVLSALPFGLGAADAVLSLLLIGLGVAPAVTGATILLLRATATLPLGVAGALSWAALGETGQAPHGRPPKAREA
ncbi:MAG: flippase-like domain-containing protein, partial [Chloroflexi bacterium]|nr:flippase-like domain-containing protein [Chloroflexota bacterium]